MDELFDVFDEPSAGNVQPAPKQEKSEQERSKKRRASDAAHELHGASTEPKSEDAEGDMLGADVNGEFTNGDAEPDSKRQRREAEPEPVVADTFETEQSREVAAAAGLQAAKEETGAVILSHQVRHQVALPPDYAYVPLSKHEPPETPARSWSFALDPFQQVSISSIERDESVLVSAHTSAGKTVVAEYAIAQSLRNNQRVIYTSPIKALSNQKYREFNEEFGDVGLMTGDVTINPTATCLVMTTEILRSMLYRGSEVMREVAWVVFDEIHYLRDLARGVVWEETIILLPDKVRYVFLSATIPNAMQFAEWITKTHNQPCHVVYTDFRPTPLQHYFFPQGADGIHLIVDEKGNFREENFNLAMTSIASRRGDDPADAGARRKGQGKNKRLNKGGGQREASDIYKIVKMIMLKSYNPVIVFSFSKNQCEAYALQMSNMTFNDDSEKAMVDKVFNNALDTLSEDDKQLPQIQNILPLLKRGIGIHHSGLLPILKESIEILFQEGLIKVLFATETFSIGLNMPAKTVVFTSVRKFDGTKTRWISPSEFVQMSGRAGRRGLDERGIVIMMIEEEMEPDVAQEIVRGEQDNLNSAFHLGYNMILNLMRVEGISPEFMLERCFYQFQNTASVSGLERELHALERQRQTMDVPDEPVIREYYDLRTQLATYTRDMQDVINHPNYSIPFMSGGRLIRIKHGGHDFGWGALVRYTPRRAPRGQSEDWRPQDSYILDVALQVAEDAGGHANGGGYGPGDLPPGVRPPREGERSTTKVLAVTLSAVDSTSHIRIFLPDNLNSREGRDRVRTSIAEVERRFPDGIPLLDPIENMKIEDKSFKQLLRKIETLEARLLANPLHGAPQLPAIYDAYAEKVQVTGQIKALRRQIGAALAVMQLDELKCRKRVLRRLGFVDAADVVQLKARVACEISTGDELLLAELLFDRFFNELSPEHCAAVLSCFVFEEKTEARPLTGPLEAAYRDVLRGARRVAQVSAESRLAVTEDEYLRRFKWQLMDVVDAWARGRAFADICRMTEVYEGSLIRVFRRLEELLRQMGQASKVMGNADLERKFDEALAKVRRDIVAAQSLYL